MRVNKLYQALSGLAMSIALTTACTQTPTTAPETPRTEPAPVQAPAVVTPAGQDLPPAPRYTSAAGPANVACPQPVPVPQMPCRFVAFTAQSFCQGSLFVYDDAIKDVYILNGALAGLPFARVAPFALQSVEPTFFGDGKVLFEFCGGIYVYDMNTETRIQLANNGLPWGSHPRISATGMLVYIDCYGNVVAEQLDPSLTFAAYTREIAKIAAEKDAQFGPLGAGALPLAPASFLYYPGLPFYAPIADVDVSADGHWIVMSLNGKLELYDVTNPHLYQVLPLGGLDLGRYPGNIAHVAISPTGRYLAFTVCGGGGERLLVLDRKTGMIDTVPYANLGLNGSYAGVFNPRFLGADDCLYFEICTGRGLRVWKYNLETEALNGLVILNNALGELGTSTTLSNPVIAH